jgi:surfactin synthase thioesterase subunit
MAGKHRTGNQEGNVKQSDQWFPFRIENGDERTRLFCFPHAGAGAAAYLGWARRLPRDIEVCAAELPGRGGRSAESPYLRLEPLVRRLTDVVRPLLDLPYLLHGHSMGALIAFELARTLHERDAPRPAGLVVTGMVAPQRWPVNPPLHQLPVSELIARAEDFLGLPPEMTADEDVLDLLLPPLRADLELAETYRYRPGPPLHCPVAALAGVRDRGVPLPAVPAWRDLTTGEFSMRVFDGDHFFLHECPDVLDAIGSVMATRELASESIRHHDAPPSLRGCAESGCDE